MIFYEPPATCAAMNLGLSQRRLKAVRVCQLAYFPAQSLQGALFRSG